MTMNLASQDLIEPGEGTGRAAGVPPENAPLAERPRRFGIRVAGLNLLLPETLLEHVADAPIFAMPGAGAAVLGLAQLRGHPVVVLDPEVGCTDRGPEAPGLMDATAPAPVGPAGFLVIGQAPDAGALALAAPPCAVRLGARLASVSRPRPVFADALEFPYADEDDPATIWWSFEPQRLFERLATV